MSPTSTWPQPSSICHVLRQLPVLGPQPAAALSHKRETRFEKGGTLACLLVPKAPRHSRGSETHGPSNTSKEINSPNTGGKKKRGRRGGGLKGGRTAKCKTKPSSPQATPRQRSYVQHRGQGPQKQPRQLVLDPKGYEGEEGARIQGPVEGGIGRL